MVLPDSNGVPRAPPYSGAPRVAFGFRYWTVTIFGEAFQPLLLPIRKSHLGVLQPHTLESAWFGLFPFRSPLLRESLLISSPAGTEMFHFPALASTNLFHSIRRLRDYSRRVTPFRYPRIIVCLATTRGFSQPATSFFAYQRQGIRLLPLLTCSLLELSLLSPINCQITLSLFISASDSKSLNFVWSAFCD